jgi:hypothetical protein
MSNNTQDLSKFGYRELAMGADLLRAILRDLPDDFEDDGITVEFNPNSGEVFLTNSGYQVAVLDKRGELESFYSTPYEGLEGTWAELVEQYQDMHPEDQEYIRAIADGRELPHLAKALA